MDKRIIEALPTESLIQIKDIISKEINRRKRMEKLTANPKDYGEEAMANREIEIYNASALLSVRNINKNANFKQHYYRPLINQDWTHLYSRDTNSGRFYVYAHVDPSQPTFESTREMGGNFGGRPFYIGKGCDDRAFNLKRNQGHGKKIKQVLDDGWKPEDIVHIVFDSLSEEKAFELEAKLIYFFGSIYQKERKKAFLYNLDIPKIPEFIGGMKKHLNKTELSVLKLEE